MWQRIFFPAPRVVAKLWPFDLLGSPSQTQWPVQHKFLVHKAVAGGVGIPCVHWLGTDVGFQVMILDRLGPSLEELLCDQSFQPFSIGTTATIACQVVCAFSFLMTVR